MKKQHIAWLVILTMCLLAYRNDIENHEQVHYIAFKDFGIQSEKTVGLLTGSTNPTNYTQVYNMNPEDYRAMTMIHGFNEAVDYNTTSIKFFLIVLIMIVSYRFCERMFGEDNNYESR